MKTQGELLEALEKLRADIVEVCHERDSLQNSLDEYQRLEWQKELDE